jgi:hypothetical protein
MSAAHEESKAAIARLRALIAADTYGEEVPELMALADQAVAVIQDEALRKKIADALIGAMTVIRFAGTFGTDPEPGRRQALSLLDLLEQAPPAGA